MANQESWGGQVRDGFKKDESKLFKNVNEDWEKIRTLDEPFNRSLL